MDMEKISNFTAQYIEQYSPLYESILQQGMKWVTINPDPKYLEHYSSNKILDQWLAKFKQLRYLAHEFILIVEISRALKLHFHLVYSVKDKVKEYKMINTWKLEANVLYCFGEPKHQIGYLFKDIDFTEQYLSSSPKTQLIYTKESLYNELKRINKMGDITTRFNYIN